MSSYFHLFIIRHELRTSAASSIKTAYCIHCAQYQLNNRIFNFFSSIADVEPYINLVLANVPILRPLKTPENRRCSVDFRGYKMEALARTRLIC